MVCLRGCLRGLLPDSWPGRQVTCLRPTLATLSNACDEHACKLSAINMWRQGSQSKYEYLSGIKGRVHIVQGCWCCIGKLLTDNLQCVLEAPAQHST